MEFECGFSQDAAFECCWLFGEDEMMDYLAAAKTVCVGGVVRLGFEVCEKRGVELWCGFGGLALGAVGLSLGVQSA